MINISMTSIETYKKINPIAAEFDAYLDRIIKVHIPRPSVMDYDVSYISRHFIRKVNDNNSVIYEVDFRELYLQMQNPFYTYATIIWKISKAPIEQIEQMNRRSILEGETKINNLRLYLPNLSQFYKDIEY